MWLNIWWTRFVRDLFLLFQKGRWFPLIVKINSCYFQRSTAAYLVWLNIHWIDNIPYIVTLRISKKAKYFLSSFSRIKESNYTIHFFPAWWFLNFYVKCCTSTIFVCCFVFISTHHLLCTYIIVCVLCLLLVIDACDIQFIIFNAIILYSAQRD